MIQIPYDGGSPLVQAINTNFAQVEASLSPLITNGGSTMVWYGYPLTGVSFSSLFVTVTGNVNQTVFTNPVGSGKRMIATLYYSNITATTAVYTEYKSNGSLLILMNNLLSVAANGFGGASYFYFLEPGESVVLVATSGSLLFQVSVMSFDVSCPLKTFTMWGGLNAGNNTIYTAPASATSFLMRPNTISPAFVQTSPFIQVDNNDTVPITYTLSAAGTTLIAPLGPVAPGGILTCPALSVLTAGQPLVLNLSASNTGNTCVHGIVWERPN